MHLSVCLCLHLLACMYSIYIQFPQKDNSSTYLNWVSLTKQLSLMHFSLLRKVGWATAYLDAWLRQARGLGQALPETDTGVWVGLEGGAQELYVFFGEAGPLSATGAARGASAGGRGSGIIWGKRREQVQPGSITLPLFLFLHWFWMDSFLCSGPGAVWLLNKLPSTSVAKQ